MVYQAIEEWVDRLDDPVLGFEDGGFTAIAPTALSSLNNAPGSYHLLGVHACWVSEAVGLKIRGGHPWHCSPS